MLSSTETIRIVQITDPHLGKTEGECLVGVDTDASLIDVVSDLPRHDLAIVTGDLSNDGSPESYRRFSDTLSAHGVHRWSCLPGNHDDPEVMARVLGPQAMNPIIVSGNWLFVSLNSRVPGFEHGDLTESELLFLDRTLARHPKLNTMVFLHHQPMPVGCAWLDQYVVRSADRFFHILDKHPNVRGVAWGHVHQDFHTLRNGVQLFGSPSTCVQFKPNCDDFAVDTAMPGHRLFEFHPDGKISTNINRVAQKDYRIDFACSGY
jgi:Icc protein